MLKPALSLSLVALLPQLTDTQPAWAQYIPKGVLGDAAAPQPLLNLSAVRPASANVSWHGEKLRVQFKTCDAFKGGFIASVQVSPWTPGALILVNYTFSNVKIQRLWNGDLLGPDGSAISPLALVTGSVAPIFVVRLHETSRASGPGQLPNAVSFMASGTAQPPGINAPIGLPRVSLALTRDEPAHNKSQPPSELAAGRNAGEFRALVTVRPWSIGELLEIDLRSSHGTALSAVRGAEAVSARGSVFVVRLAEGIEARTAEGELPISNSFELKANGPLRAAIIKLGGRLPTPSLRTSQSTSHPQPFVPPSLHPSSLFSTLRPPSARSSSFNERQVIDARLLPLLGLGPDGLGPQMAEARALHRVADAGHAFDLCALALAVTAGILVGLRRLLPQAHERRLATACTRRPRLLDGLLDRRPQTSSLHNLRAGVVDDGDMRTAMLDKIET